MAFHTSVQDYVLYYSTLTKPMQVNPGTFFHFFQKNGGALPRMQSKTLAMQWVTARVSLKRSKRRCSYRAQGFQLGQMLLSDLLQHFQLPDAPLQEKGKTQSSEKSVL